MGVLPQAVVNPIGAAQNGASPPSPYEQGQPYGRGNTVIPSYCAGFLSNGVMFGGGL